MGAVAGLIRGLVSPANRMCGMPVQLRHKVQRQKQMVIGVLCQTWGCQNCVPHLREKWKQHLSSKFMEADTLYVSQVPKLKWHSTYVRLQRQGADYAIIEQPDGNLTLFTPAQVGGEQQPKAIALTLMEDALDNAITDHRPVHTSRSWGLPKTPSTSKLSEWERVDRLPITVEEAERVVRAVGLQTEFIYYEQQVGFVFTVPESWLDGGADSARYEQLSQALRGST